MESKNSHQPHQRLLGTLNSWGLHLKKRGNWWHYYRSRPVPYEDVEPRALISFSLKTRDFAEAKMMAAQISHDLELEWREQKARGVSLRSQDAATRFAAACEAQSARGFAPKQSAALTDEELLARLRSLILGTQSVEEEKAVLGVAEQPNLSLSEG